MHVTILKNKNYFFYGHGSDENNDVDDDSKLVLILEHIIVLTWEHWVLTNTEHWLSVTTLSTDCTGTEIDAVRRNLIWLKTHCTGLDTGFLVSWKDIRYPVFGKFNIQFRKFYL